MDGNTCGCIGNFSFQIVLVCKLVNKGSEAYSLYDPVYPDSSGNTLFGQSLSVPSLGLSNVNEAASLRSFKDSWASSSFSLLIAKPA